MEKTKDGMTYLSGKDFKKDQGHENLIMDLESLLRNAQNFRYHDFKSELGAPKMELRDAIDILGEKVIRGKYDN